MVVGAPVPPELASPQAVMLPAAFMAAIALLPVKIWVKPVPVGAPVPPLAAAPQVVTLPLAFMAAKAEALA